MKQTTPRENPAFTGQRIFLSAVTGEFRAYRSLLASDLRRAGADVSVQEDFGNPDGTTLEKLDREIRRCRAVVHLIGDGAGATVGQEAREALLLQYPDLPDRLKLPDLSAPNPPELSYTQWEAYLALYHGIPLHMADIQLTRARLFRDREALAAARELIRQTGYHRRDGELADAEAASAAW